MSPGQLAATVQDSKAKRQERLKSRFRDRGGIFVPAEGNVLAQILLERGVNGESPAKRRSPRKSTAARSTPKSARSAKVATKTPRTTSKRARKSTVADELRVAPVTAKKNKQPSTAKSKTPKSRGRVQTKGVGVGVDGAGDVAAAPPPDSTPSSRSHPAMRPKSFADRLADALNSTSGNDPPDPMRLVPCASSRKETKGKGKTASARSASTNKPPVVERRKRGTGNARGRTAQRTAVDPVRNAPQSPSRGPRGDDNDNDNDSSDHSDLPLAQKLAKTAPADARPKKSGKGARPRAAPKAKTDAKRGDDEPTKRTAKSATAGREASANSRKRGAEEPHGHEETTSTVAPPPRGVALPPTKRARVLQEKNVPHKRKERAKNVDDGNTANNETENGPPAKKRRRADPPAVSRRRRGKENENGVEPNKSAPPKASKKVMDKPLLLSPQRKTASKGKPPLRTRARSRGLPPDVLRRIKVNARTLDALKDIDDDDPIDFLRS
ncbi:hypothetical protein EI94DRAFT_1750792 [Lactarius quietus]|nr:hypothetical protein EI94DRAFT_1750792 [Lactarius quietus]